MQVVAGDPLDDLLLGPSSAGWGPIPQDYGHLACISTDGGHSAPPPAGIVRGAKVPLAIFPQVGRPLRYQLRLIGMTPEKDQEPLHGIVDPGQGLIEPIVDRVPEEVGVAIRLTKRQPIRFEKESHQRGVVGVGRPGPYCSETRALILCLCAASDHSQSIAHSTQKLFYQLVFTAEVVQKDRGLSPKGESQRPKRQVGDSVGDDIVDSSVKELLAAPRVGRSSHHPSNAWRCSRGASA